MYTPGWPNISLQITSHIQCGQPLLSGPFIYCATSWSVHLDQDLHSFAGEGCTIGKSDRFQQKGGWQSKVAKSKKTTDWWEEMSLTLLWTLGKWFGKQMNGFAKGAIKVWKYNIMGPAVIGLQGILQEAVLESDWLTHCPGLYSTCWDLVVEWPCASVHQWEAPLQKQRQVAQWWFIAAKGPTRHTHSDTCPIDWPHVNSKTNTCEIWHLAALK